MQIDFRQLSPKALWRRQSVRIGAALTVIGGVAGVVANLTAVADIFSEDKTRPLVEETRLAVVTTDAKVDEILKLMRLNAAIAGGDIDPQAEGMISAALTAILTSGDTRKAAARKSLENGDVASAAAEIERVAREQEEAASGAAQASAESWREAAALYAPTNPAAAIASYQKARELDPGDFDSDYALAALYHAVSDFPAAERLWIDLRDNAAAGSLERGRAIYGLGALDDARGNSGAAAARFREALEIAKRTGDASLAALSSNAIAALLRRQGKFDEAERLLGFSLAEAKRAGREDAIARALMSLGLVAFTRGDADEAIDRLEHALAIYEKLGDLRRQSKTIGNLGAIALERGELDAAERYILRSIEIGEKLKLKSSVAEDLINLTDLAIKKGDLQSAEDHLARAQSIVDEAGLESLRPYIEISAGQISAARGNKDAACVQWAKAASGLAAMKDATAETVVGMAQEAGCAGSPPAP